MNRNDLFLCLTVMAFLVVGLTACQTTEGSPTRAPQISVSPTKTAPDSIQALWQASPHAQTYVLDDTGTNSTCARCHAPLNYVPPQSDMPAACASCKFTVNPPPPTTAKSAWENISCNICHRVNKGVVSPKYAWLAIVAIEEYEDVTTTTDLCRKCHAKDSMPKGHAVIDIAGTHSVYVCTKCHDAHSTKASCTSENCHASVLNPTSPIPGHDKNHNRVTCVACHDAAGLKVGPDEKKNWVAFLPASSTPFTSHNIVKKASCERCHFPNNPWKLSGDVSKGAP